jgi:hypothetical protein
VIDLHLGSFRFGQARVLDFDLEFDFGFFFETFSREGSKFSKNAVSGIVSKKFD